MFMLLLLSYIIQSLLGISADVNILFSTYKFLHITPNPAECVK